MDSFLLHLNILDNKKGEILETRTDPTTNKMKTPRRGDGGREAEDTQYSP